MAERFQGTAVVDAQARRRVLVVGASGTIGQTTTRALLSRGHEVVCIVRLRAGFGGSLSQHDLASLLQGAELRVAQVDDPDSLTRDGLRGETFDAVVSCLASRNGAPSDAWAIDHAAHLNVLTAAHAAGAGHFVLLSALCVQKPRLAFQHAKLAFEQALMDSGMDYSIVRPTAFFKSLSGQVARVKAGKPYLLFGDGRLTACKPISDRDLADYLVECLEDPARRNRILPIGGPGPALTPREQGEQLFALLGRAPRFRQIPLAVIELAVTVLTGASWIFPRLRDKAEFARIARYYATESMLVWNAADQCPDAEATPSTGSDRLVDYHAELLARTDANLRSDHSLF